MKKLAGLIIILAVLLLGGYYGMGLLTEKAIKENVQLLNQGNGLNATLKNYKRGFLTSDAQITWQFHVPEYSTTDASGQTQTVAAQDYTLETPLKIYHGPVIFANRQLYFGAGYAESTLSYPSQYNEKFDALFTKDSIKPKMDLNVFINYFNKSTLNLAIPAFNLIAKTGNSHFEWMGLQAKTHVSSEMKEIDGTIHGKGLRFNKDKSQVDLTNMTSQYQMQSTAYGLYTGEANFNFPAFQVLENGQKQFEISQLNTYSKTELDGKLFSASVKVTLDSILANNKNFGPGVFEVAIKNLDAEVLARINQQAGNLNKGSDLQRQQAMITLFPEIPKLFSQGAQFEVSTLSMKIPEGQIEGNLLLTLPKDESANPFALMQKAQGHAKLKVPTAVVKMLMLESLKQQLQKEPELQQTLATQLQASPAAAATSENTTSTAPVAGPAAATPVSSANVDELAQLQVEKQLNAMQQTGLVTLQGSDYLIEVTLDAGKFTVNGKPFDASMLKF